MLDLQKFVVIEKHGFPKRGKFSQTYLLREKSTDHHFVLKTIKKTEGNESAVRALRNEADFSFNTPGLPEKAELFETTEEVLLLRKFKSGDDLLSIYQKITKGNRRLFLQLFLLKTLPIFEELNEMGIVHGDIRPENFLITPQGKEDFSVSLIDFGLSFYPDKAPNRKLVFHLLYSPPEAILNQLDLCSTKSDLFSLGIVIYRLLAQEIPFKHPNPSILTNLVLTYPLERHSSIPKDIWHTIEKMCVKTSFKTSPNRLAQDEMRMQLLDAIKKRSNVYQIQEEVSKWKVKNRWFSTSSSLFGNLD